VVPAPAPSTPSIPPPVAASLAGADNWDGIPKALRDLMEANEVRPSDIRAAVAKRGYYPMETPIANYDPDFVNGVLIGAWPNVLTLVRNISGPLPF